MSHSSFVTSIESACLKKEALYSASKMRYAVRSIYAGAFLTMSTGAGVVAADLLNSFLPGAGRFLFPFVFAWGLVFILFLHAELTTSNMMYLTAGVYLKKIHWKKALEILLFCTIFNLIGALLIAFLFNQTSAFQELTSDHYLANMVAHKIERSSSLVLFEGILANVFVNVAILSYLFVKDQTAKILLVLTAVYMFVFLSNEHVAANFASISLVSFSNYANQVPGFELLNLIRHILVTFFANWIGGGLLIGLAYAWLNSGPSDYLD